MGRLSNDYVNLTSGHTSDQFSDAEDDIIQEEVPPDRCQKGVTSCTESETDTMSRSVERLSFTEKSHVNTQQGPFVKSREFLPKIAIPISDKSIQSEPTSFSPGIVKSSPSFDFSKLIGRHGSIERPYLTQTTRQHGQTERSVPRSDTSSVTSRDSNSVHSPRIAFDWKPPFIDTRSTSESSDHRTNVDTFTEDWIPPSHHMEQLVGRSGAGHGTADGKHSATGSRRDFDPIAAARAAGRYSAVHGGRQNDATSPRSTVIREDSRSNPKGALHDYYQRTNHGLQIRKENFVVWKDEHSRPHIPQFTCIFVCPITGEEFAAGLIHVSGPPSTQASVDGAGTVWYSKKQDAKSAAAARAYDCIMFREAHDSSGSRSSSQYCQEDPYLLGESPRRCEPPLDIADQIRRLRDRIG